MDKATNKRELVVNKHPERDDAVDKDDMEVYEITNEMKRKAASSVEESSDDEEQEVPSENEGVVRDVLSTNMEIAAANAELTRKLQAKDSTIQLLASQAGVPSEQLSDWLYAQSVKHVFLSFAKKQAD